MSDSNTNKTVSQVRWNGDVAIVDVQGDIDLNRSVDFQKAILSVLEGKPHPSKMLINLTLAEYMDSSGVASLVKLLSKARKSNVGLVLFGMSKRVRSVFEITRLDSVFEIKNSEQEALG